jgi:2-iminobutanoate/2-iminopropanoate deaminase
MTVQLFVQEFNKINKPMKTIHLILSCTFFIGINFLCFSQGNNNTPAKEKFNLNKESEDAIGYAQAVKVGNTIYVSGSVGWGAMENALVLAYDEIGKTLQAYNTGFANVIKENLYTTALDSVIKYKDIRRKYYGTDYPAATWVEVKRLYDPGLVVEIEVIAIVPEDKISKN